MFKILIVFIAVSALIGAFTLWLLYSNASSKKKLLKYLGFATICSVLAIAVLSFIVVLF